MVFKTMMMGVIQHTFGLGSSLFDMGSDVVNALNMLGSLKYSPKDTMSLSKSYSAHLNNNDVTFGMNEPIDGTEEKTHHIWGTLSMLLIFLPGFVFYFPVVIQCIREREWSNVFKFLFAMVFFPTSFIFSQLRAIITVCRKEEVDKAEQTRITSMNSAEATLESTGQLLLQLFTLLNGYPSTTIQKITICTSFFQIARSVILQDLETKIMINEEESLSFCKSLIETLKRIPIYVPTMIFRCGSLVVTMAYLRSYSFIPIAILLFELGWVSWIRFRKFVYKKIFIAQIIMSNIGVLNSYAFLMEKESEDEKDINKFIARSSVLAFVHHSIVIVIIMVMGYLHSDLFTSTLILKPSDPQFYYVLSSVIAIGAMSLAINLCCFHLHGAAHLPSTRAQSINNEIELQ